MRPTFTFSTPMELKVLDPRWVEPGPITDIAQAGEALGFDEVTVYDHFLEPPAWQPSYLTSGYDPIPLLAHLAAKTSRIRLAVQAINIPYRHPAVMANELATIDKLSGGRLVVGVVAGYLHEEYDTLGLDWQRRGDIADEYLAAMVALWTNEVASFKGEWVRFPEVRLAARPVQQPHPELWSFGGNARALRRAIRWCRGWGPITGTGVTSVDAAGKPTGSAPEYLDRYADLVARLAVEQPGRHVPQSKTYEWMHAQLDARASEIAARGRPLGLALNIGVELATLDRAVAQIDEQIARGATRISVRIGGGTLDEYFKTQRAVGEQVLPEYAKRGKEMRDA